MIRVDAEVKRALDERIRLPRETYNNVLRRILRLDKKRKDKP
jgi:hypothetical protein